MTSHITQSKSQSLCKTESSAPHQHLLLTSFPTTLPSILQHQLWARPPTIPPTHTSRSLHLKVPHPIQISLPVKPVLTALFTSAPCPNSPRPDPFICLHSMDHPLTCSLHLWLPPLNLNSIRAEILIFFHYCIISTYNTVWHTLKVLINFVNKWMNEWMNEWNIKYSTRLMLNNSSPWSPHSWIFLSKIA